MTFFEFFYLASVPSKEARAQPKNMQYSTGSTTQLPFEGAIEAAP